MNWLKEWWRRLVYLRRRDEADADLVEEMRLHLELRQASEGHHEGAKNFGNITALKEKSRDAWGWGWLDSLTQDLKYGWRNLLGSRGFTITAILSLALGIGANTAIFSILNAVLLKSLPVPDPHRLVKIDKDGADRITNPIWEAFRDHQNTLDGVFAFADDRFDLAREGEKQLVNGLYVSGDFFSVLQVGAQLGRVLNREDDLRGGGRFGPTAVLSHAFWESQFGSDPAVIGKPIYLNGNRFEIVGVSARGFTGMDVDKPFSVAIPICAEPFFRPDQSALDQRSFWWLRTAGRLAPGMSIEQAQARLKVVTPQILEQSAPQDWDKRGREGFMQSSFGVQSAANGFSGMRREDRVSLYAMMGVVATVLLIACANIANLLLARAAARQQEISVRMAIGAARKRLMRQLLTESFLLAALGIPFGLLLAKWGSQTLIRLLSSSRNPLQIDTSMDSRVLFFTIGITLLTGLFFGLAPALRATRISPNEVLKQTTRTARAGGFRLGKALVAGQVALSLALLVGAALFVATLRNLLSVPLGFNQQNVVIIEADLHGKVPKEERQARHDAIIQKIEQIPGVVAVSTCSITPISGQGWNGAMYPEGAEIPTGGRKKDASWFNSVGPGFFAMLQTPVLLGREFDQRDRVGSQKVIILGERTAREFFASESAIGKRVTRPGSGGRFDSYEVVGVVGDTKYRDLKEATRLTAYFPSRQDTNPSDRPKFLVRVQGTIASVTPSLRTVMAEASPGISLEMRSFEGLVKDTLNQQRLVAWLAAFFGGLALALALVGLYGVTSYTAAQRKGEIGIRMALGAQRGSVIWLVLRDVMIILAMGSVVGIAMSMGAGRLIASLIYGIEATDFTMLIGASVLLSAAGAVAGLIPAWKASRLDPAVALRCE